MESFYCPYLKADVELTTERRQHIESKHPELLPEYRDYLGQTLTNPDEVRRDARFPDTRIFTRWFDQFLRGKYLAIVVVTDTQTDHRHWIVTAYVTRMLRQGEMEWKRN